MTRRPHPSTLARQDAIVAALTQSTVPLGAMHLARRTGSGQADYTATYRALSRLEQTGRVERIEDPTDCRTVRWVVVITAELVGLRAEFDRIVALPAREPNR